MSEGIDRKCEKRGGAGLVVRTEDEFGSGKSGGHALAVVGAHCGGAKTEEMDDGVA
jgi:hypothetical protein